MNRLLSIGLRGATLLLAVLACRPAAPASPTPLPPTAVSTPAAAPPPVTITWATWGDATETAVNQRMAAAFSARHPGIQVELITRAFAEYYPWLEAEWEAGRPPDVVFLSGAPIHAARGRLLSLTAYVEAENFPIADFFPQLLRQFEYRGQLYGLPRDTDTKVIYYNKAIFDRAGQPYPQPDWTWADLRAAAIALTNREASGGPIYGFGFESNYWWRIFVWQNGADLLDHPYEPTRPTFNTPAAAEAIQFLADLVAVDRVTPPADTLRSGEQLDELFASGRLAIVMQNHARVPTFARVAGLKWDIARLPRGKQRANFAGGAGFAINSRSAHPREAWELIKFLTGPEGQAMLVDTGLVVSARRSVREDNVFLRALPYDRTVFLEETELGRPSPSFAGVSDVDEALDRALLPVWTGGKSAAQALREVEPEVARLLRSRRS